MYMFVGQPHQTWPTSRGKRHTEAPSMSASENVCGKLKRPADRWIFFQKLAHTQKLNPYLGAHGVCGICDICDVFQGRVEREFTASSRFLIVLHIFAEFMVFGVYFFILYNLFIYYLLRVRAAVRRHHLQISLQTACVSGGKIGKIFRHLWAWGPSFNSYPPTAFYTTIALHLAWQANKTVTLQLPPTGGIHSALEETMLKSGGKIKKKYKQIHMSSHCGELHIPID